MIKRNLRLKSHVTPDQAYQAIYKKIETKVSARAAKTIIYSPRSTTCSYLIRSNNSTPRNFSQQQIIPQINKIESPSISFRTETTKIQRKTQLDIFGSVVIHQKKKQFKRKTIFSNIQKNTKSFQNIIYQRNSVLFLNKMRQNIITQRKMQISDLQKQRLNFDNQEDYQQTTFYVKMYLNDMLMQQIAIPSTMGIPFYKYKQSKKVLIQRREAQHFDYQIEKIHFDDPDFKIQYPIKTFGIMSYPEFEDVNVESFPDMDQNDDELFIEDKNTLNQHSKIEQKPIEMLMCFEPYNQKQFPIISYLDDETKNKLLSVDYSQTDKIIYESNIFDTIVPDLTHLTDTKYVYKQLAKLINYKYSNILTGTYTDLLQLTDLEHEHQQEEQIKMPKLLKQQTKFKLKSQASRYFSPQNKLTRIDSKKSFRNNSSQFIESNKYQSSLENADEIIEDSPQIEFKNKIKLSKYQVYNNMVKNGKSKIKTAAMLIEYNMINELRDFLRQNLNFKLNQYMKDGTPLIVIAARAGFREIMQLFLDERVDTHQIDQDGKDAYYHAIQCQNYDVADLLVNSGY